MALRYIEAPVILCVWSDAALQYTYDAGKRVNDSFVRRQNSNYWSLALPKTKPSKPWLIFNMAREECESDWSMLMKIRFQVSYSYEMVLILPPLGTMVNDNRDWLHDAESQRGMQLLKDYTGSEETAKDLLNRIHTSYDLF